MRRVALFNTFANLDYMTLGDIWILIPASAFRSHIWETPPYTCERTRVEGVIDNVELLWKSFLTSWTLFPRKALGSLMGSWTTFGELGYPNYSAGFGGQGYIMVWFSSPIPFAIVCIWNKKWEQTEWDTCLKWLPRWP